MGIAGLPALVASAALTATSVGITARVFADLGYLQEPEGWIVLGAAVIDDVLGLILLTVVFGLVQGNAVTVVGVVRVTGLAVGFLLVAIVVGKWLTPHALKLFGRIEPDAAWIVPAFLLALGMAWLAHACGSAPILGAFVAGLILNGTAQEAKIEHAITQIGQLFVPVFFACVGASVDLHVIDPTSRANWATLGIGVVLISVAVSTKFLAGYAPWWFRGRKAIIGVGMIPRGEVGIIFAQMGERSKVLDSRIFGAVTLMVVATTFLAPVALRALIGTGRSPGKSRDRDGIGELVTEA
jgi:Kef-type K+ transport system membrane component KefB